MLRTLRGQFITYSKLSRCWTQLRGCSSGADARLRPTDVSGTLTGYEVSRDEFKWVERILPPTLVPEPPTHESYPTPSGWVPQKESSKDLPYHVRRTRFHNMPIYLEERDGGIRKITVVRYVEGDIWQFESDLHSYLEEKLQKKMYTQVDELCNKVRVRGIHLDDVKDFLLEKGL